MPASERPSVPSSKPTVRQSAVTQACSLMPEQPAIKYTTAPRDKTRIADIMSSPLRLPQYKNESPGLPRRKSQPRRLEHRDSLMPSALPVIDLAPFIANPQSAAGLELVARLRGACHGPGFCYLVGHGVPPELDAAVMADAREFFALPEAERRALAIANSPHFRGYTVLGGERTTGVNDWREQLDVGLEEPAAVVTRGDPLWRRLRGPNQWPARLPAMQPTVLAWMRAMDRVGLAVLRALALGLGQPLQHFDDVVLPRGDPHLKIIRYPAQGRDANAGTDQGVGMHHDSGLVSFVLQDDVGGLQVEIDGELVEATP